MFKNKSQSKSIYKIIAYLIFLLLYISNCTKEPSYDESINDSRNLNNSTSTFIYNVIPRNRGAKISPEYRKAINIFSINLLNHVYMPTTISIKNFIENECITALINQDTTNLGGLKMPKFFFNSEIELIPILKELGINGIFNPDKGEITEMIDNATPNLYVSKVKHKAGIKTDEEGTKAYAATVTLMGTGSYDPSPDIILNNPFVYFIRAGENGLVLFTGVVNNPSEHN